MFLDKSLAETLQNPPAGEEDRHDELRADLTSFLVNRWITPEYLWLLKPKTKGVWETKSRRIEPQMRVFGQFAARNVFLALTYRYRSDLGGIDDPNWMYEIRRVEHRWQELFLRQYSPKTTSNPHELFSGAIDEKYFAD